MDVKLNSEGVDEKRVCTDNGSEDNRGPRDSLPDDLTSQVIPNNSTAGLSRSLTEVTTLSEQIPSTLSVTDHITTGHHTLLNMTLEAPVDAELQNNPKVRVNRALPIYRPWSVEKGQPQPLSALLPSSTGHCTEYEMTQSCTSISKSQQSLKTTTTRTECSNGDDPCAAVLLACLFCRPLDCFSATLGGCNACVSSLCSSLCGCEPLLDVTHQCSCCGCLDVRCCLCDCPVCDICLQATECLDLAMEISQMLYH